MKKNYINPALEVINVKSTEILAGSITSVEVGNDNITAGDQVGAKEGTGILMDIENPIPEIKVNFDE